MNNHSFWLYLLVMAAITYLIRMIPLVLVKKKIENKFVISFLYYIPYAVLSVMTIPAIFYATSYKVSAVVGFVVAVFISYFEESLLKVAAFSCLSVFIAELIIKMV